jgi:hypothetical protein
VPDLSGLSFARYAAIRSGCLPGRCGKSRMHSTMNAAMIADATGRLNANPPSWTG